MERSIRSIADHAVYPPQDGDAMPLGVMHENAMHGSVMLDDVTHGGAMPLDVMHAPRVASPRRRTALVVLVSIGLHAGTVLAIWRLPTAAPNRDTAAIQVTLVSADVLDHARDADAFAQSALDRATPRTDLPPTLSHRLSKPSSHASVHRLAQQAVAQTAAPASTTWRAPPPAAPERLRDTRADTHEATPDANRPATTEARADARADAQAHAQTDTRADTRPAPSAGTPAMLPHAPEPLRSAQPDYAYNPPPDYPLALREQGLGGEVWLKVRVEADGRPSEIVLLRSSGYRLFDDAAQQAVRRWRFLPARQAERALASWVAFPVRFSLHEPG